MYPLSSLHTFGLNSKAVNYVSFQNTHSVLAQIDEPHWILGQGSNCVFVDDFEGTIIHVNSKGVAITELDDRFEVVVQAGEDWHQLVITLLKHGIYGAENLALIPGTVGAAPIQNIGAYGVEVEQYIQAVQFVELGSGQTHVLNHAECQFGYRDSIFKQTLNRTALITQVTFSFPKQWHARIEYGELKKLENPTAHDVFHAVTDIRQAKLPDPAKIGNAGSFFKNPIIDKSAFEKLRENWPKVPFYKVDEQQVKVPAAWLIEQAGFKGKREGGIQSHPTQPLVLTNDGTGSADELLHLAREIKARVEAGFAVNLENEVNLIGKKGIISL